MKAVRYHSYGDSDVLVHEEADRPVAGAGQVVVQVAGTSFNPVDAAIRAGLLQQVFPVAFPHVPNFDVAGVIAEVGEGVQRLERRGRGGGVPADDRARRGRRPRRSRRRTTVRQDRPDPA